MRALNLKVLLAILVVATLLGGFFAQPSSAQDALVVYDYEWLETTAARPDAVDVISLAWMRLGRDVWRDEGFAGTHGIPANSVVVGSSMNAGNDPAFNELAPNIWHTPAGGQFGTAEGFLAFQLEGSVGSTTDTATIALSTVDTMIIAVRAETEYGRMIELLDLNWSNNPALINRWGLSGPLQVLTDEQLVALETAGLELQPLVQELPGNTMVWGDLAPGELHSGLVLIAEDIYATTCQGGKFASLRGFRAMQFPPAMADAVISDTEGCAGLYPPIDPDAPVSVQPLGASNGVSGTAVIVTATQVTPTPAPAVVD